MTSLMSVRPRWSMIVSHHPPSQYDRTLHIGHIRFCARCTGLLLGIVSAIAITTLLPAFNIPSTAILLVSVVFVLSIGIAAFVLNETGNRASNNYERILFGFVLGCLIYTSWLSGPWAFLGLLVLAVVGQFVAALLLRRLCVLDRFVNEYLDGAKEDPSQADESPVCCSQLFCTCNASISRMHD